MEEVLTESTETVETNSVEEMSDDEFAQHMDGAVVSSEDAPEGTGNSEPMEEDLEAVYKAQMEDKDLSIDKPIYIKINGQVTKIDNVNDLKDLSERGLGATKKMQEMAEDRKFLQYLSDNGISKEQVDQLIASSGNEPIEQNETAVQVEAVAQTIIDRGYADDFKSTADMLPQDIRSMMGTNPQLMQDFAGDVQSGLAQQIMPRVDKLMAIKGIDFFTAYGQAGSELQGNNNEMDQKKQTLRSQPKAVSQSLNTGEVDVWSLSDSDFDKYFDKQ